MRAWLFRCTVLPAGVLTLVLASVLVVEGISPLPAEAAGVKVSVACKTAPEKTRVENRTNHAIKVRKVGSTHQPRSNEPFKVGVRVRRGQTVTFESGYDANRSTLTRQYIYDNEVGRREGTRVSTSAGRITDRC